MNYWTAKHQTAIVEFYHSTGTTSGATRNYIYTTTLYPAIDHMLTMLLRPFKFSSEDLEDIRQFVHLRLWNILNCNLKKNKLQGTFNYLWISARNHLYTQAKQIKKINKKDIIDDYVIDESDQFNSWISSDTADNSVNQIDNRLMIIDEIESKQSKLDSVTLAYIYLEELKQYLIANDFVASGFDIYVKEKYKLNDGWYKVINNQLGILPKEFKTDKFYKDQMNEYNVNDNKIE